MNTKAENIYQKLPVCLQHLVCCIEGYKIQRSRFGSDFEKALSEAESRSLWSNIQIHAYRDERLRSFVKHCYETVPFYRHRFDECKLLPADIRSVGDLNALPVLTKDEVQSRHAELVSTAVPRKQQIIAHTSGTTGGGLRFATTLQAIQAQWATWWRFRRWHGIGLATWCGYFGGRSVVPLKQSEAPFWRYNYLGKQILFSGYHMSAQNMSAYVNELQHKQPPWLHGYPSLLSLLAIYVHEKNLSLGYQIRLITTGAENLLLHQADIIQKAFGIRAIQHYGMAEAVANFSECEQGRLHVDEDFAAVDFLPNGDGQTHRVLGTNFTNPATPLLRYDVGDDVVLSDEVCSCGKPGRIVARVDGRKEDYIIMKNGARIGRMDHIFKDMVNIREAQIYQKYSGEIEMRIVRGALYTNKDERILLAEVRKRVGEDTIVHLNYLEKLERSKIGKLRFVVSDLKDGKIDAS